MNRAAPANEINDLHEISLVCDSSDPFTEQGTVIPLARREWHGGPIQLTLDFPTRDWSMKKDELAAYADLPELLTIQQAAPILGYHENSLAKLCTQGAVREVVRWGKRIWLKKRVVLGLRSGEIQLIRKHDRKRRREMEDVQGVHFVGYASDMPGESDLPPIGRNGMAKTERGWIYVLDDGMGHFKIGWAYNLDRRVKDLKIQLPFKVRVAYAFETDNPRQVESILHRYFADRRLNGEWFALKDNPRTNGEYDFDAITYLANDSGIFENVDGTWYKDGILNVPDRPCSDEDFERQITELFEEGLFNQEDVDNARLKRYSNVASVSEEPPAAHKFTPTVHKFIGWLNREPASSSEAIH